MSGPLAGRRVVVTRAADQAEPLASRLRALGAEPVLLPLIDIVAASDGGADLASALAHLGSYDWLVVTSPNGAQRVRDALHQLAPARRPRLAAVGSVTAAGLGLPADLVPATQLAYALVAEFPTGSGSVLLAQAEQAGPAVGAGLTAKGWRVDVVAAYRTVPIRPTSAQLLTTLSADAVLFASGSAVRAWTQVFGTQTPAFVIAIGPSTAQAANDLGLKVDAVAADHSLDGLVGELVTQLTDPH